MINGGNGHVRAAVIGVGHMGEYHALAYAEMPDVDLVGVVDLNPHRAATVARHYDTLGFTDHRELVGRIDVASVAVPTEQHFSVARDLLEGGVSILVEKPMTPTVEEARALFEVASGARAVLHVGHVERYNGAVDELRQIVHDPILIESRRLGPFVPRVAKDTVVMDLMIHDIDIVLALVESPPVRLAAQGTCVHSSVADVASVQIRFESGAMATITASRATEEKIRTLAITQPDAYVLLDYTEQDIHIYRRAAQQYTMNRKSIRYSRASFVEHLKIYRDNPLKLELQHLIAVDRRRRAGEHVDFVQPEDLRSLAMALEIERMIRDGIGEAPVPVGIPWSGRSG